MGTTNMARLVATSLALLKLASADTCAFCHHTDVIGSWEFSFTDYGIYSSENVCDPEAKIETIGSKVFTFTGRDTVTNANTKSQGHWTLVYDEGFELTIDGQKWWAYFKVNHLPYDGHDENEACEYKCNSTMVGVVHDVQGRNWACFTAEKLDGPTPVKDTPIFSHAHPKITFEEHRKLAQKLGFKVNEHPHIHESVKYLPKRKRETPASFPDSGKLIELAKRRNAELGSTLPANFDWDDMGFVSPVKNQGSCGSCFAFASVGMLEARARVQTNNVWQPLFSEQEPLSCHQELNQGCEGGFAYLTAGKYGNEFGYVEEECFTYKQSGGRDMAPCQPDIEGCKRHFVSEYGYVGGYYGAGTAHLLQQEVFENGPVAIGIDTSELHGYEEGIVVPTGYGFDPLELVGHAVLITGWGVGGPEDGDQEGLPYWKVKNSWGDWGENGYFRVLRGVDAFGCESILATAKIIPPIE